MSATTARGVADHRGLADHQGVADHQGLAEYQALVARALSSAATDRLGGADVIRWSVREWAVLQLSAVCPVTTQLLRLRGRLYGDVDDHLRRGARPSALHRWGRAFLRALSSDDDPLVADVALLELATTAPAAEAPTLPDPWVWTRDPVQVVAALLRGSDPRDVPLGPPTRVHRRADGSLTTCPW